MRSRLLFALAALPLLAPALLLGSPSPANARGGDAGNPRGPAPMEDPRLGPRFFDQAVKWVNDNKPGVHNLGDFYADLADVKFAVGANRHEGHLRLWLKSPDKYRFEVRTLANLEDPRNQITTKILSGPQMWILHPNRTQERMHGRPEGAGAVRQLQEDRRRLLDLARFLTLEGLRGQGVEFINEGPKTGSGTFEGRWMKVRRRIVGGADVTFHLAYESDPSDPTGQSVRCTYPGVVTVVGDPAKREPTEYYVLRRWIRGPQFHYPGEIQAFSQDSPQAELQRFLLAYPKDILINTGLEDGLFSAP